MRETDGGGGDDPAQRASRGGALRWRLILFLALAIAPAAILAFADGVRTYRETLDRSERRFLDHTIVSVQSQRDQFIGMKTALEMLADMPAVRSLAPEACSAALDNFLERRPQYALAAALDPSGVARCAAPSEAVGADLSAGRTLSPGEKRRNFGVDVVDSGAISGRRVLVGVAPIREGGVVTGSVSLSLPTTLNALFDETGAERVDGAQWAVVDASGELLLSTANERALFRDTAPEAVRALLRNEATTGRRQSAEGVEHVLAIAPLISGQVWLIASAPADVIFANALGRAAPRILGPFAMLLLALSVAYFLVDRLVLRHLFHLQRVMRAYGAGRLGLEPTLSAGAPREIVALASDLASMAERLAHREAALRESANANRVLLREVYHRVKNNLQMIASLLSLQASKADSAVERDALRQIGARIHAISAVHEKLYRADDLEMVDLGELIRQIASSASPDGEAAISVIAEPVAETAERATPLALFVNEALADAVKHHAGAITLSLVKSETGAFDLIVSNPVAEAGAAEPDEGDGLGARLMRSFARQLRAELHVETQKGRRVIRLSAPKTPEKATAC